MRSPFVGNELYGLGYWLKDYAHYPQRFPLCTFMEHGAGSLEDAAEHEVKNNAAVFIKFSPSFIERFRKSLKKPVFCILNPFIHYRIKNGIKQSNEAKGTLFFAAHSLLGIDGLLNWDSLINELETIPEYFKPIDICLHPVDVYKGLDQIIKRKGYKVYTAGYEYSEKFAVRFYNILKEYKYTMSNVIGSHTFYSVELGIPFSIFGKEPIYVNRGYGVTKPTAHNISKTELIYLKAAELFQGFHTYITPEQNEFANFELGKTKSIGRTKAFFVLLWALLVYFIKHPAYFFPVFKLYFLITPLFMYKWLLKSKDWEKKLLRNNIIRLWELCGLKLKYSNERRAISLMGKPFVIADSFIFLHTIKEVFCNEIYKFSSSASSPLIIDCKAETGISIVYFKNIFPNARIMAFEPDRNNYDILEQNCHSNNFSDIKIINKAIGNEDNTFDLYSVNLFDGKNIEKYPDDFDFSKIQTIRLKNILSDNKVDLLKIEIIPSETIVISDCIEELKNVKNVIIKYHTLSDCKDKMDKLILILKDAGFTLKIYYYKSDELKTLIETNTFPAKEMILYICGSK